MNPSDPFRGKIPGTHAFNEAVFNLLPLSDVQKQELLSSFDKKEGIYDSNYVETDEDKVLQKELKKLEKRKVTFTEKIEVIDEVMGRVPTLSIDS